MINFLLELATFVNLMIVLFRSIDKQLPLHLFSPRFSHQFLSTWIFQRDLPIGIIGSLLICVILYIGVCLVITGMVPYKFLGEDSPLADAFTSKGLKFVAILISVGAVAGLTTTLLVGLYVQVNHFIPIT